MVLRIRNLFQRFSLTGVARSAKARVVSTGATSLNKTKELSGKLGSFVARNAGGLASAALRRLQTKLDKAHKAGKPGAYEKLLSEDVKEKIEVVSDITKKADEAVEAADAAAAAKAAAAAEAAKAGKPSAVADAAEATEAGEAANKNKKQVNYLKIVGILSVIAAASATAAVVMKMYSDLANAEKEQCLARWETTYMSIIKDENGELLEIDSAEKWSENLVYIEHKIESHPEVNGDPEKANAFLVEMYNGLLECISIDTSAVGAFLKGISEDLGKAIGNVVEGATEPVSKAIDSSSNLFRNIAIAVAISAVAILVVFFVWKVVTARSERRRSYINDIGPIDHIANKPPKKRFSISSSKSGRGNNNYAYRLVPTKVR